jgi:large subunit ribosomal protein L30
MSEAHLAIVRIRGINCVRGDISDTMDMLGLQKKNVCVILKSTPVVLGMIKKIADYVTWGEVSEETIALLVEKRSATAKKNEFKQVFFLAPPVKGFEKKGIKKAFTVGGALGYRADKINALIARMV